MLFEPEQVQSAISPNNFIAQEARIFSKAELADFWSRILFTKQPDTTLKILGKGILYDFLATCGQHSNDFYSPYDRNWLNP